MIYINEWLRKSCLLLNSKKTVYMVFSKHPKAKPSSNITLKGAEIQIVDEFKYLGVTLDSSLSFKKHVKTLCKVVNLNICNFKQIRSLLPGIAAKIFLHSMIFLHIEYCITNWSMTNQAALKPIESSYKRALKILDKKLYSYHHCLILHKYNYLRFDNLKKI